MVSSPINLFYVLVTESTTAIATTASSITTTTSTTGNLRNSSNLVLQHFLKFSLSKHSPCKELFDQKDM